jgi:Helicase associated domain
MFALLEKFKLREGHFKVPALHKEEGVGLGLWLIKQKKCYMDGSLDPKRKKKLNSIGYRMAKQV